VIKINIYILGLALVYSCQPKVVDSFTTKAERERFVTEKTHFIDSVFSELPNPKNEKKYRNAFWASELMLIKSKKGQENISYAFNHFSGFSDSFKISLLQHIFTLYQNEFVSEMDSLISQEPDEKRFAIMANYLIRQDKLKKEIYLKLMYQKFTNWKENPILMAFYIDHSDNEILCKAKIDDLIKFRRNSNEASFYVFVHKNRDFPAELLIQNSKGEILKENGDTLRFKLLARSITNLSEYISNGNTPEGVYSVQGFSSSDNIFIGKSPTIITTLPFEISLSEFSFGKSKNNWSLENYNKFYPKSWRNYLPKNMAFYAGKAGRGEIIIHGTTIDTEFYRTQPYYPFTPSLGCLCTLERWNIKDGSLIESEQIRLVKALKSNNIQNALMYVIEE